MNLSEEAVAARREYLEQKEAKKKAKIKERYSLKNEDIENALRRFDGNMSMVAQFLGTNPTSVWNRIMESPRLQEVRKQIVEEFLDLTESKLRQLVKEANPSAVFFVLKTLGKNRGYTERSTVEHEIGPFAAKNAAIMIEAMRKGAETQRVPEKLISMDEDEDATIDLEATISTGG
jgi:hypothetical protein